MEKEKIELVKKLFKLREYANFDFLLEKNNFEDNEIIDYYKKTKHLIYRFQGSKEGFMHIGISYDGKYKKGNRYEFNQAKNIDKYIKETNAKNILELGSGQGSNLLFLSKLNKDRNFMGLDLYPSIDKKQKNVELKQANYHDLSFLEDNSVDLIYAIETLCYSTDKETIFKEVKRVLKKDGLFIIYDGYLGKPRNKLSEIEFLGANLVENGFCLTEFEYIGNIDNYIKKFNFNIIEKTNMKENVLPHMINARKRIDTFMKFGFLFKIALKLIPKKVMANMIPVYFMEYTINTGLSKYYLHILKK